MYRFAILWLVTFSATAASSENSRCERISIASCQGIGYNITLMPNFLGHESQEEAKIALEDFKDILDHKCSQFLRLFVCSVYVPLCSEHVPRAVQACRGLCEQVKSDCMPALQLLGLQWPEHLNCTKFPEQPDLCMQQPDDDHSIVQDHQPSIDDHIKFKPRTNCPRNAMFADNVCTETCNSNYNGEHQRERALYDITAGVSSLVTFLVTSFALLTFIVEPKRFRWPARPILFLTVCGFITCLIHFLRWIFGPYTCTGEASISKPYENWLCISVALVLTFCEFAFCIWWFVFSLVWYLSAAREWSTEAIERSAPRLHAATWTASIAPIIYALISNSMGVNTLTGFCEATNDQIVAFQMAFVAMGSWMAVLTFVALKNVRRTLMYGGKSPLKLERLIYRFGIVSAGVGVPLFASMVCYFWGNVSTALLRVGFKLLSVVFAALWVFSSKTFRSWNKILRPSFTHKNLANLNNAPVTKV